MQKKKGKTTIPPLLTFNLKVGFTFSVLSPSACLGHALLGDVLLGHTLLGVGNCRLPLKHAKACPTLWCYGLFGFGGFGLSKMCFGALAIKVFA